MRAFRSAINDESWRPETCSVGRKFVRFFFSAAKAWNQHFRQDSNRGWRQQLTGKASSPLSPPNHLQDSLPPSLPPPVGKREAAAQHQERCALAAAESWSPPWRKAVRPVRTPFRAFVPFRSHASRSSQTLHARSARSTPCLQTLPSPPATKPFPRAHHCSPRMNARASRPGRLGDPLPGLGTHWRQQLLPRSGRRSRQRRPVMTSGARSFLWAPARGGGRYVSPGAALETAGTLASPGAAGPCPEPCSAPSTLGRGPQRGRSRDRRPPRAVTFGGFIDLLSSFKSVYIFWKMFLLPAAVRQTF